MARTSLGTLVASIDANTRGYEMAMARMEALTIATTRNIERRSDPAAKAVDRLTGRVTGLAVAFAGLNVSVMGLKLAGMSSLVGPAVSGIGALAGAAVIGAQSLAPLSGALAGMPFLLGAAGQGAVTAAAGLSGLIKVMGQSGDITKFNEELKNVDPATASAARSLYGLRSEFADIKAAAASGLLPGVVEGIQAAAKNSGLLKDALFQTGTVLGDTFAKFGEYIGSDKFGAMFKQLSGLSAAGLDAAGGAFLKIFDAVTKLTVAAKPMIDLFLWGITAFGDWVAKTTDAGIASGKFQAFIENSVQTIMRWGSILHDLGSTIGNIFKAASGPAAIFLGWLQGAAEKLDAWSSSAAGMNKLTEFFANISVPLAALGKGLGDISLSLSGLFSGPAMQALAGLLSSLGTGLASIGEYLAPMFIALAPLAEALAQNLGILVSSLLQNLLPVVQILSPVLTDLLNQLGPVIAQNIGSSATSMMYLAQALANIFVALAPLIPMWSEYIKTMGPMQTEGVFLLSNALIGAVKAVIWLGQSSISVGKTFMAVFIFPVMDGIIAMQEGLAQLLRAMGQDGLAGSVEAAAGNIRAMKDESIANWNAMNGTLDEMQNRLNFLSTGITIPITIDVVNTSTLDGIMKASKSGTSFAPPKPVKQPTYKMPTYKGYSGNYGGPSGGGSGGGGGQSAKSKAQDAFNNLIGNGTGFLTGLADKEKNPVYEGYMKILEAAKGFINGTLRAKLDKQYKALNALYQRHEKVQDKLEKAQNNLASLRQERDSYRSSLTGSAKGYGSAGSAWNDFKSQTSQGNLAPWLSKIVGGPSLLGNMNKRLGAMKSFLTKIRKLRSLGLNDLMIRQILDAGIDDGSAMADAILADSSAITDFNKTSTEINNLATNIGKTGANMLYSAGIQAGAGLVKGLQSQESALAAQMRRMAKIMINETKAALGIKSPSKAGIGIGQNYGLSLVQGMGGTEQRVGAMATNLAAAMVNGTGSNILSRVGGSGGGAGAAPVVISVDARGAINPAEVEAAGKRGAQAAFDEYIREVSSA